MPIYMKFEGAKPAIPGTVKDAAHPNWVEVDSFQLPRRDSIGGHSNQREAGPATVRDATFTLRSSASAHAIWANALTGPEMKVTVDFVESAAKPSDAYLSLILERALLSSVSIGGGGDQPMMSASLNFTTLTMAEKKKPAQP